VEPSRVGIRELRQNLSVYLRRVARGERFVVTERREPVAALVPLSEEGDEHTAWLRRNKLAPATVRWEDLPPPIDLGPGVSLSEDLQRERDDQRY
jgi:prevent-host-death family protein